MRAIYEQDPRLNGQIQITDGNSNVLTPFSIGTTALGEVPPIQTVIIQTDYNPDSFVNESKNRENRQPPFAVGMTRAIPSTDLSVISHDQLHHSPQPSLAFT